MKIIISLICSAIILISEIGMAEMVSIKGNNVNLRTGPGQNYSVKCKYGSGFPLSVEKRKGKWLYVTDFENDKGWIYQPLTDLSSHVIVKTQKGRSEKINIRQAPDTSSTIVGQAYHGVVFKKIKEQKTWIEVKHETGLHGWIEKSLLWGD